MVKSAKHNPARGHRTTSERSTVLGRAFRIEPINVDSVFSVLDAVSWLGDADVGRIAQFAGVDARTAGKVVKNCVLFRLVNRKNANFSMAVPYPFKGSKDEKKAVIREALLKLPLVFHLRQFLSFGENSAVALRKAATMIGIEPYDEGAVSPILKWARELEVLEASVTTEALVDAATETKERRHRGHDERIVAFLSHSSADKVFARRLAADLTAQGITIWLDEENILVGDSITEKIGQGLAQSDFFLIVLSANALASEWLKKELNQALIAEVEKRKVHILPVRIDASEIPPLLKDKHFADFAKSYTEGFEKLLTAMKRRDT